ECGPALGEEGESAFAEAAQGSLEGVVGAVVDGQDVAAGGLLERDVYSVTCTLVAGVGQDRHRGGGRVGGGQYVLTGRFDVHDVAGFDVAGPDRKSVGFEESLDVAAEITGLPRIPLVDRFAFHADGFHAAPVGVEDLAVQDQVPDAVGRGLLQGLVQVGGASGQDLDALVQVAVARGRRQSEPQGVQPEVGLPPEPRQHEQGLVEAGQSPRTLRSAAGPPLGEQQPADEANQFTGDVEHGRI